MRALGIAVRVSKWKSTVSLVLLETTAHAEDSPVAVLEKLTVTDDAREWASHVGNVASAVRGHAKSMELDVVVVRRADQSPQGRNSDGPKLRLMIEGGIVAACLDVNSSVQVRTGHECGKACATTKESLDQRAELLSGKAYREACAAALSAVG